MPSPSIGGFVISAAYWYLPIHSPYSLKLNKLS